MVRLILSVALVGLLAACGPADPASEPTVAERFPGPWREFTPDVARTLAKNGVRGCGEFYQRLSATMNTPGGEEYLVACTRDGDTWAGYLVWPSIGRVLGPDVNLIAVVGPPTVTERDGVN